MRTLRHATVATAIAVVTTACGGPSAGDTRDAPVAVGESLELAGWTVTVDDIDLEADQSIADANRRNDPPRLGNHALVSLTVTLHGDGERDAGLHLLAGLSGADGRQYTDLDCSAVEPTSLYLEPTVQSGETVSGQFCIDYPDEALGPGAALFVEDLRSSEGARGWWALPD